MAAGPLTSNHVNYLIWRYLQEAGHGQSAARLQRDWGVEPEALPFARHIGTHALVSLVQKGLQYHEIEKGIDQYGRRLSSTPSAQYFGTLNTTTTTTEVDSANSPPASPTSRKHARERAGLSASASTATSAKRSRQSNGLSNGHHARADDMELDERPHSPTQDLVAGVESPSPTRPLAPDEAAMDLDVDADALADDAAFDADGSHGHEARAVPGSPRLLSVPPPRTVGRSVGVQSDKLADLGPETSVWRVPSANVTHAQWNPVHPEILATGGEALCRIWHLSHAALARPAEGDGDDDDEVPPFVDLRDGSESAVTTSMAWSPDGESLAVATFQPSPVSRGTIAIKTRAGETLDALPGGQDWVLNLTWNAAGSRLLGLTHSDHDNTAVMAWNVHSGQSLEPLELRQTVMDVAWLDDARFVVCGPALVARSRITEHAIAPLDRSLVDPHDWSAVRTDALSSSIALAAESSGHLALLADDDGHGGTPPPPIRTTRAHDAEITALQYQPIANPAAESPSAPRLLASASVDGAIKLWDARHPWTLVHVLAGGRTAPAMALSFTPDGYLVAVASADAVRFWIAEAGGLPRATWSGKTDGRWGVATARAESQSSTVADEEAVHSLTWDADGGKLAYGLRDQIAIINFRRPQS